MPWSADDVLWLRAQALEAGFSLAGVAPAPAPDDPDGHETAARFQSWVDSGRAGEMDYLKRRNPAGDLLRTSARVAAPWVRSVVVCALNYNVPGPTSLDPAPADTGWIARYAWSAGPDGHPSDYHQTMLARLAVVEAALQSRHPCQTRSYVDTGPVLERDFAARAGVGWTGKNTCILNQSLGSWLLLGVILTSLEIAPSAASLPAPDRCGSCTRCLDACPTGALTAPREMDASLCISYLTIEKKGSIPLELRAPMGRQVFGCDICQEVCPWNRRAPIGPVLPRPELMNPTLDWLGAMDNTAFRLYFRGSPLDRTRRARLQRNVAIAMGNSHDSSFRPRLLAWSTGDDPILAEAAQWALTRLPAPGTEPASIDLPPPED